jgi:hypothetical protein
MVGDDVFVLVTTRNSMTSNVRAFVAADPCRHWLRLSTTQIGAAWIIYLYIKHTAWVFHEMMRLGGLSEAETRPHDSLRGARYMVVENLA